MGRKSRTVNGESVVTAAARAAVRPLSPRRAGPSGRAGRPGRAAFETLESRQLFAAGDLVINEFLTKNDTGIQAADGSRPDWVEVYNPGTTATNLAGWTIVGADVDGVATTYTIPSTNATATTVAAGGYKILWCDGDVPGINASNEVHTNFKLDKAGGSLTLKKPDGTVTSAFAPYPEQLTDVSYGLGPSIATGAPLVGPSAPVKATVPTAGTPSAWNQLGFDDSAWTAGSAGVGFENVPAGGNPVALPAEVENGTPNNDSAATANDATTNFAAVAGSNLYHLGISTATLSSTTDTDYYLIGNLQAGDVLSVLAMGSGTFGTGANTSLTLYRGSNPLSLTTVVSDTNSGPGSDGLIDRLAITATDTYYVAVPPNSTTNGAYQLGVYLENAAGTPTPTTGGTVTAEAESNGSGATATNISTSWRQVQYRSRTNGQIASAADADYYKLTLAAGDRVTINADSTSATDMKVSLVAANGTTVVASEDGSSTRTSPFDKDSTIYGFVIPSAGTYYVKATGDAAGSYTLDVNLSTTAAPPAPGLGGPLYASSINTNVGAAMQNVNASAYVRAAFTLGDSVNVSGLSLGMKYDDGFVAYLNGTEVARSNAPGSAGTPPAFNAAAASDRQDGQGTASQTFDLTAFKNLLVVGQNVLAIQGLNNSAPDPRFLVAPELTYTTVVEPGSQYFSPPTPGAANGTGNLGQVSDTKFSVGRGFYSAPIDVAITTTTPGATIRYTLDGTAPSSTVGAVYSGPIHVTGLTTLRAVAYQPGYLSSNVDTQTYLFAADVGSQTVPSTKYPAAAYPATWSGSFAADYNVDLPDAIAGGGTAQQFANGLVDPNVATLSIVMAPGSLFDPSTGIYQNPVQEGAAWERAASIELINPDGSAGFQIDAGLRIQGSAARQPANQPKHSFRALFKSAYGASNLDFPIFGPGSAGLDTLILRATYNNSWTHSTSQQRDQAEYARDGWNRVTQEAMGHPAARQKFVQLYLNGLYWGLYDVTDRPEDSWAANQLGGQKEQYEIVNSGVAVSGPPSAGDPDGLTRAQNDWSMLNSVINNANISTPAGYDNAIANWIDPTNLADYIIQNYYNGNQDWDFHNYYGYRDTSPTATNKGWRFVAWDSERTLESPTANVTALNTVGHPTHIFRQLMTNPEFQILFADRIHKAFFNDGALTPAAAGARYAALADQIKDAVVDESARWGDYRSTNGSPVGTKTKWQTEVNRLLNNYFPVRTANTLGQFSANGWYPSVGAPEFAGQFGGAVGAPYTVTVNNPNAGGTVYYTTDGSDPRLYGGGLSGTAQTYNPNGKPVLTSATRIRMRVLFNGVWSAITDATFIAGPPPAVRVSEFMYHAQGDGVGGAFTDDDYDYIELQNVGTTPVGLAGLSISSGVTYTFPTTGSPTLQPGQRVVIAGNVTAFANRYGAPAGVTVMGTAYDGKLSNNGESIALTSALGQVFDNFTYSDQWYPTTDGDGYALVAIDPAATDEVLSTAAGWKAGAVVGGTPGKAEPVVISAAVVGDGTTQRSRVTQLTVTFDSAVSTWDAGAFVLTRRDPGGGAAVAVPFSANLATDGLSVALAFTGTDVIAGSLADGVYDWLVRPALIRDAGGTAVAGADRATVFHRLFGDINGDRIVNNADNNRFKQAYLKTFEDAGYVAAFDYKVDGIVNNADNSEFKKRYLMFFEY